MPERTPLPPPDAAAALHLWTQYAKVHPELIVDDDLPPIEIFGDSVELADALIGLVLAGTKRATAGLLTDYLRDEDENPPRIGAHWVACDGSGTPRAVLRTLELRIGVIESVDEQFAWDEGEGDRTRADWLRGHRTYFVRTCAARGEVFTEQHEVIFERFALVWPES